MDILPQYLGGLIGFISHDAVRLYEKVPALLPDHENVPDLFFQAFGLLLCFDHKRNIVTIGLAADPEEKAYEEALKDIDANYKKILESTHTPYHPSTNHHQKESFIDVDLDDATFRSMVEKAKEQMEEGNILKVILSRTFKRPFSGTPLSLFRASMMMNPSPYHYLFQTKDFALVGASPEKLISAHNGKLESIPVAGTYARVGTTADKLIEEQIMNDPKINIEHMMPVDVVRSDLAAVSIPGTVHVDRLKTLELFSHVVHVASYLSGHLKPHLTPIDALKATFPAGTLCGVARVPSLAMIEKMENSRRGVYGGVMCTMDTRGNLDSCIIIRTAMLKNGVASVRTGAGLVIDSDPQKEADETRHKSKSMMNAMNMAEEYFS
jgi:anthranilate synthase component 1